MMESRGRGVLDTRFRGYDYQLCAASQAATSGCS